MKPPRRVILYRHGLRPAFDPKKYADNYNQKARAAKGGVPCPKCGRVYKDPNRAHYSDPKNKTPCL